MDNIPKYLPIGILSLFLLTIMAGAAVSPALADIQKDLAVSTPLLVKMILTLPALMIIPTSFTMAKLSGKYTKKHLALFGVFIYICSGILAILSQNIYQLLATRALLGVAVGIIMPVAAAMIADFYQGEQKIKMMGYGSACSNLGGIVATSMSGMLASLDWRYAFLVYMVGIPVFFLVLIFAKDKESLNDKSAVKKRQKLPFATYAVAFPGFMIFAGFYCIPTNIAVYLTSTGLGGPPQAGYALAFSTGTAMIMGLFVARVRRSLGRWFVASIPLSMVICHSLLGFTSSIPAINIAMIANGYTLSMAVPYIIFRATETAEGNNVGATSTVTSFIFLGQFFSPVILGIISGFFNGVSASFDYKAVAVLSSAGFILTVLRTIIFPSRSAL